MSHRSRRSRRAPGLIELAMTSDWRLSGGAAIVCVIFAVIVIPVFLGGKSVFVPLMYSLTTLSWGMALAFAGISLIRFQVQRAAPSTESEKKTAASVQRVEPSSVSSPPLTARDKALLARVRSSTSAPSTDSKPTVWSLEVIDRVEWKRFEDLCCEFYRVKGIRADTTRLGPDGGVDIRLFQDATDLTRCTAVVQCKAWKEAVGVKAVRELRGVMAHEKVEKAFFMAPNGFTDEARSFATENRITLLDGKLFLAMLLRLPEASRQQLLAFATEGDWTTPTCPSCGVKMVARESARGRFWGCSNYPKCRGKLPMRKSTVQASA